MGIFLNEVGYKPSDKNKKATVNAPGKYVVVDNNTGAIVYKGDAVYLCDDKASGDICYSFDFSKVSYQGQFYIFGPLKSDNHNAQDNDQNGQTAYSDDFIHSEIYDAIIFGGEDSGKLSVKFEIKQGIYDDLALSVLKCLYYQRCGCSLESKHAGIYTHAKCHTGKAILLEDYLSGNPDAVQYEVTGGWHDAGDFGRYLSPAGVTIGHLLYAYEIFPGVFGNLDLNIPESGNGIPDILNEAKYELTWMLKMQSADGGVYHKLTAFRHAEFIMPEEDKDQFILFPVSSMATADFAASMALAYRVYKEFDTEFADRALTAARKAFDWLTKNDYVGFHNPQGSDTGEYDDDKDSDERFWAAAEMLRSDPHGNVEAYRSMLEKYAFSDIPKTDFGWTDVAGLGSMSILTDPDNIAGEKVYEVLKTAVINECDRLLKVLAESGYEVAMETDDFVWGSNMVVSNRAMLFCLATLIKRNSNEKTDEYVKAVQSQLNYLLGRNALGRSYITGFGEKAIHNPHNRVTACDGIDDPMPGWVSGGPFMHPVDEPAKQVIPRGTAPMKCHTDLVGSYSTNEITIYWNSPVVFMLGLILLT